MSKEETICPKCFDEFRVVDERFTIEGIRARALYAYDETFRERLLSLKGGGDIEMAPVFLDHFELYLRACYFGYTMVFAPSYEGHDKERGYNHVEEAFKVLGLPYVNALVKTEDVKQAGSSDEQRKKIGEFIKVREDVDLRGKRILFCDDVYTTGATAKACLTLLKKAGAKKVAALFLSKAHHHKQPEVNAGALAPSLTLGR